MKKVLAMIVMAALLALALVGCGNTASSVAPSSEPASVSEPASSEVVSDSEVASDSEVDSSSAA